MNFEEKIVNEGLNQAIVIAKERAKVLELLKQALLAGDDNGIRLYASQICGVTYESN